MKRTIIAGGALALAAGLFTMSDAQAADPACASGDTVNQSVAIGVACAAGDPATQSGHVYVDGNEGNPGASQGYVGVNSDEEESGVVGCASGNYGDDTDPSEGAGDPVGDGDADPNVIIDPMNPPEDPNELNPSGSPCSP